MAYITSTQFTIDTGISLPQNGFTAGYIDLILSSWTEDINNYTNTQFNLSSATKDYKVPNCSASYINIESWQATNLTITLLDKNKNVVKILVENQDYRLVTSFDESCIIALDLQCLEYVCDCDLIRVEGNFGWSQSLPDKLRLVIYQAIRALIATKIGGYSSSTAPIQPISYLQQERSRNITRVHQTDTQYSDKSSKLAIGMSIVDLPEFKSKLVKYKADTTTYFINLGSNCCYGS